MIQSKRIAELMDIYKQAEKCYKYNQSSSFYRCLENKLVLAARKYNDEKEILEEYKIACQSYLDSNILKTNISIATLVLSIAGLLKLIDVKVTVEAENYNFSCAYCMFRNTYTHEKKKIIRNITCA